MRANARCSQMQREISLLKKKKALGVKTRNDADRGRVAAHKMICDGVWMVK
jgi:hypothetical protein